MAGQQIAEMWEEGLEAALATLATMPRSHPFAPEHARFRHEVRQLLYRRPGSSRTSPVYRILFSIRDDTPDGPIVVVFHVRHGAQHPITAREARELEGEL